MAKADFQPLFERFKAILAPYAAKMHVSDATPGMYGVDMAPEGERDPSTWFAGTRLGKRYVSYYLMPIYVRAEPFSTASHRSFDGGCRASRASTSRRWTRPCSPLEALTREGIRGDRRRSPLGRRPARRATHSSEVAVASARRRRAYPEREMLTRNVRPAPTRS